MKDNLPLVSIGIITYNQKNYLIECIESVLAQDYPNIEVVIGDDGSTDGTKEILKKYLQKYPQKFKLILSEENCGITCNLQKVLDNCSGKYIIILGGDDLIGDKNRIMKQVKCMEKNKELSLCGTYVKIIDSKGELKKIRKDKYGKLYYNVCDLIRSCNGLVPVVSYMFRKKDAVKLDHRLPKASDSLFFFHIASKGQIYIIPEILSTYRVHNSLANQIGYIDDSCVALALCEYYFPECLNKMKEARANLYYSIGRIYMKNGNKLSRKYLWNSLTLKFKLKTLTALILSILGIKI